MATIYGATAQPFGNVDVSYRQDNLIAGNLQPVTQSITLLKGQGVLRRGTILGKNGDGLYVISKSTATDGSQDPCAVLVDTFDTSGGNVVNAGVYQMGEFNANHIIKDDSWTIEKLRDATRQHSIFLKDVVTADDPS